jgi:hypothetical protein
MLLKIRLCRLRTLGHLASKQEGWFCYKLKTTQWVKTTSPAGAKRRRIRIAATAEMFLVNFFYQRCSMGFSDRTECAIVGK